VRRLLDGVRSRLTLDRIAIAIVLVGVFLGVRSLTEGSSNGAPVDHAVGLVPKEALLYVHVRVDQDSAQWRNANEAFGKLPTLGNLRDRALREVAGGRDPRDLESQVQPWLGDEVALALLPGRTEASSLILLQVADRARAQGFLGGAGQSRTEVYRGTPIRLFKTLAAAFLGDFLAIGRRGNVLSAIRARDGDALARDDVFERSAARLDIDDPLLYLYAPDDGVRRLLQHQPGLIGRLGDLLARPGLLGVAVAARFQNAGIRLAISSELVPLLPGAEGGESTRFEPRLPASLPGDTIAYFGVKGIDQLFDRLTVLAGGERSALSRTVTRLRRSLGRRGVQALNRAIRPLRDREAALVVTPPAESPIISLVVGATSKRESDELLVALQPAIARLLETPQEGQVPTFEPQRVAGVEAVTLGLTPALQLTYAAFDGRIVVSTSRDGIRRLRSQRPALADSGEFAPGLRGFLAQPTSVVFLDLHRLSALVERAGLGRTPEYRAIRPDIGKIGTVSVITTSEQSSQTAQVFIKVP
jgi:uncharacterized protein DUF3352